MSQYHGTFSLNQIESTQGNAMTDVIYLLLGAIIATAITLYLKNKFSQGLSPEELAENQQLKFKLEQLQSELDKEKSFSRETNSKTEKLAIENQNLEVQNSKLDQSVIHLHDEKAGLQSKCDELAKKYEKTLKEYNAISNENTALLEQSKAINERLSDEKERVESLKNEFKTEFENISNKILETNSKKLSETSQSKISEILNPLNDKLKSFEERIQKQNEDGISRGSRFDEQITRLMEMNEKLSTEANSLSTALKGDNKTIGNYGEVILRQVLEYSGLQEGTGYTEQGKGLGLKSEDGKRLMPDVVLNLPDGGCLVVDSKMSLQSYEAYANADVETQLSSEKNFVTSVSKHIDDLSSKNYEVALGLDKSPDFTLLFMPIEHAFHLATKHGTGLYDKAWAKHIILVSPSTLLAILRTLENIWKREDINKNAMTIADEAGKLYDKFEGFVKDLENVGKSIGKAQNDYDLAHKKLSSGRGNIVGKIEGLKKLGAKTKKSLPDNLLGASEG